MFLRLAVNLTVQLCVRNFCPLKYVATQNKVFVTYHLLVIVVALDFCILLRPQRVTAGKSMFQIG
jgi:hypothetical protein